MVDSCLNIQSTWSIVFCWLNGLSWSTISGLQCVMVVPPPLGVRT